LYTKIPLSLFIKKEVEIRVEIFVYNIHLFGLLAYKSNANIEKHKLILKNIAVYRKYLRNTYVELCDFSVISVCLTPHPPKTGLIKQYKD
jgi:hypothetical protein